LRRPCNKISWVAQVSIHTREWASLDCTCTVRLDSEFRNNFFYWVWVPCSCGWSRLLPADPSLLCSLYSLVSIEYQFI
jgi:hypothetical protein